MHEHDEHPDPMNAPAGLLDSARGVAGVVLAVYDHRVTDGVVGARFLAFVGGQLSGPDRLYVSPFEHGA